MGIICCRGACRGERSTCEGPPTHPLLEMRCFNRIKISPEHDSVRSDGTVHIQPQAITTAKRLERCICSLEDANSKGAHHSTSRALTSGNKKASLVSKVIMKCDCKNMSRLWSWLLLCLQCCKSVPTTPSVYSVATVCSNNDLGLWGLLGEPLVESRKCYSLTVERGKRMPS